MKKWLEDPEPDIWLSEVKWDTVSAKCKVCSTVFKLSAMGKSTLKDHSKKKKHQFKVKKTKTFSLPVNKVANKIFSSVSFQSGQQNIDSFVYTSQTIAKEIV